MRKTQVTLKERALLSILYVSFLYLVYKNAHLYLLLGGCKSYNNCNHKISID